MFVVCGLWVMVGIVMFMCVSYIRVFFGLVLGVVSDCGWVWWCCILVCIVVSWLGVCWYLFLLVWLCFFVMVGMWCILFVVVCCCVFGVYCVGMLVFGWVLWCGFWLWLKSVLGWVWFVCLVRFVVGRVNCCWCFFWLVWYIVLVGLVGCGWCVFVDGGKWLLLFLCLFEVGV